VDSSARSSRNSVQAEVRGPVIQAGTVEGGINVYAAPAPASAPALLPRQLPPVSGLFTGRAEDLARIDEHWASARSASVGLLLVAHGTAGVGKTSLAVAWLSRRDAEFPDGHLYADLGGYSTFGLTQPADVLGGFLRALGIDPDRIPQDIAERAAMLRSATAGRCIGVLLDNARTAAQVRAVAVAAPGCATLVTSREALTGLAIDAARFHRVEPWRPDTGVALMKRVLGDRRVDAEEAAALRVATLCGGLPLAVGVAAARLAARPDWPIARLAETLALDAERLDALSAGEDSAVAAALDGSYAILGSHLARLYRALGALPLVWADPETVGTVLDWPQRDAEARLEALVDANLLLEQGYRRYRLHDLVRLHAARCSDGEAARTSAQRDEEFGRLCDAMLGAATAAKEIVVPTHRRLPRDFVYLAPGPERFADAGQALDWLQSQRPNLMAQIRHCAANGMPRRVWQLADAMWPLFQRLRYTEDGIEAHRLGLDAARADGASAAEGNLLTSLAIMLARLGEFEEARTYNEQAVAFYERTGDLRGIGQACTGLAKYELEHGDVVRARELFARVLTLWRRAGYPRGVYLTHQSLARTAFAEGKLSQTAWDARRSYRGLVRIGDSYDAAWSLAWWACANAARGRNIRAQRQWERAGTMMTEAKSRFGEAGVSEMRGNAYWAAGDVAQAEAMYRRAADGFSELSHSAAQRVRDRLAQLSAELPPAGDSPAKPEP
jgi:tetratricopeptide (TPR) repeat protein